METHGGGDTHTHTSIIRSIELTALIYTSLLDLCTHMQDLHVVIRHVASSEIKVTHPHSVVPT